MSDTRWLPVATLAELAVDSNKAFRVDGQSLLLCHTAAGVFALANRCTHQLAALEGGRMRGHQLYCPKHGACFDIRTGIGSGPLGKTPVASYAVQVSEDGAISVALPAAVIP